MKKGKTDILIIHLNGEEIIRNCLASIYQNTRNFQVYILLNKTTDNSENLIKNNFPLVKIFKTDRLMGFAEASNFLAEKANSDLIVFLNNDVIVEKGWLSEMIKTLDKHKNCIAVQPKIKAYNERKKFEYAGAAGGFIDIYGYPFCRGRIFNSTEEDRGQYNDEIRIFWGCGVCLLIKRGYFIEFGCFDEDFFMYGEETDFCWRTNIYGKEIWYCPKSTIYHMGSFSVKSEKISIKKDYLHSRNHILLLIKNYGFFSLVKILPKRILLEVISAIRFFPGKTITAILSFFSLPFEYIFVFNKKRKKIQAKRKLSDKQLKELMYNGSIALDYFLKKKTKFSDLKLGK